MAQRINKQAPVSFSIFCDGLPRYCNCAQDLIIGARALLYYSEDAENGRVLLAKATHGSRTLLLVADRDNFEFVLKTPERKSHVAGGNLASDLKGMSLPELKRVMIDNLEHGCPIIIPGRLYAK